MRKQFLLPCMIGMVAVTTQGAETSLSFPNMLGDTCLSRLHKPETKISDVDARKASFRNNVKADRMTSEARWMPNNKISRLQDSSKNVRLDSIMGYDANGNLFTRQVFNFDENGKLVARVNSFYDSMTGTWEVAEDYGYEWNDKGNIVSEYCIGYGSGLKYEYKYNERDLGIEKVEYLYENDTWVPNAKGEYGYDENDNINDEVLFYSLVDGWQAYSHTMVTWDDIHRQTSYESYEWNGIEWTGVAKEAYTYFRNYADKLTLLERWYWVAEKQEFRFADQVIQKFDDNELLTYQGRMFWNEDKQDWSGNYPSFGTDICTNVYSDLVYDDKLRLLDDVSYYDYEGDGNWFKSGGMYYRYTDLENGDYDMEMNSYLYFYPDNETKNDQRRYGRFNANGKRLWMLQQMIPWGGNELANDYEEKYQYDDNGNSTLTLNWTWDGLKRIPALRMHESYDADSNISEQLSYGGEEGFYQEFDSLVGSPEITDADMEGWVCFSKFTYGYENGERISKFGYMWDGDDWLANFGDDVVFDFSVPASRLIVPDGWKDPYKIDSTSSYTGTGDTEFMKSTNYYFYTELPTVGVASVRNEGGMTYDGQVIRVVDESAMVEVFDLEGRRIASAQSSVSTEVLPKGMYIAKSNVDGKNVVMKIVVR